MEIQDIQRPKERRTKPISIRTFVSYSKWLAEKNISPSSLFNQAVKELMEKEKK